MKTLRQTSDDVVLKGEIIREDYRSPGCSRPSIVNCPPTVQQLPREVAHLGRRKNPVNLKTLFVVCHLLQEECRTKWNDAKAYTICGHNLSGTFSLKRHMEKCHGATRNDRQAHQSSDERSAGRGHREISTASRSSSQHSSFPRIELMVTKSTDTYGVISRERI